MLGGHPGPASCPSPAPGAFPLGHLRPLRPAGGKGHRCSLGSSRSGPSLWEADVFSFTSPPQLHARCWRGEKVFFPSGAFSRC